METKSAMAQLIEQYGFGFDKMEEEVLAPAIKPQEQKEKVEETKPAEPADITIKCKKCGNDFVWSVREQEFYKEKGFYRPAYCKECRKKTRVVNNFHKDM